MVVREENVRLHMLGRRASVVAHARQRKVRPQAIEQHQRNVAAGSRRHERVGQFVPNVCQQRGGEMPRQVLGTHVGSVQVQRGVQHIGVRNFLA